jgi:nicotinamide-nucleotide amidase
MTDRIEDLSRRLLELYRQDGRMIATAESCTGGLISARITDQAGSSHIFERGFVTYTNQAKSELLGVPEATIANFGAVSAETAFAMAEGALEHSNADIAVSVTGVAGPGGGSAEKPVGLVYFGLAAKGADTRTERHIFPGDRRDVRAAAVTRGLELLLEALAH